jgi:hypothetical protein
MHGMGCLDSTKRTTLAADGRQRMSMRAWTRAKAAAMTKAAPSEPPHCDRKAWTDMTALGKRSVSTVLRRTASKSSSSAFRCRSGPYSGANLDQNCCLSTGTHPCECWISFVHMLVYQCAYYVCIVINGILSSIVFCCRLDEL